ncbi:hypothetical protein [Massilia alkalitolerans]|uniref:hypothetical protein n=1 Tax=Massilia alkalitolerans TaxID=286638 RepID=UPI0028AF18EF|nr:hypothetical protein [Massilia alkalitolerans]
MLINLASDSEIPGTSKNLLRVAFAICDARRAFVRLRFSTATAAARDGFSRCHLAWRKQHRLH